MPTMRTLAFQGLGRAVAIEDQRRSTRRWTPVMWLQQFLCAARPDGHQMILKTDRDRLFLVCRNCFRETPGWEVAKRRPRVRFQ
jgi:hypothetical protein